MCGHKAALDYIKAFSETDFTEDLKKIDVPTLVAARRRRPDRADWRLGLEDRKTGEGRDAENLSRCAARPRQHVADLFNADLLAFIKG